MAMAWPGNSPQSDSGLRSDAVIDREQWQSHYSLSGIKGWAGLIDYRMVLLGSLLPDIIDKPVWFLVSRLTGDTTLSGRGYAHTLLFSLILCLSGLVLIRYKQSWLLIVSLSSFMHLILDQIWDSPVVLLWPLLGPLPERATVGWFPNLIQGLFLHPSVYIPEIIGLLIVLFFVCRLVIRKSLPGFLKDGAIR